MEVPVSTLQVMIEREATAKPITQGQTPKINGTLATELLVKHVKGETIIRAARDVSGTVTTSTPARVIAGVLKGGASEVTRVVIDHIPEASVANDVIDAGQAIAGEIIERTEVPGSKLTEMRYVVHYTCNFQKVEAMGMHGDKLNVTVVFDWDISTDLKTPIPVGLTVKGVRAAKGVTAVKTVATISSGNDAKLNVSFDKGGTQIEVRSLSLPGVGLNLRDLTPLHPTSYITERVISEVVKKTSTT